MSNDKKKLVVYPVIEELKYRQNIDVSQLNRMLKSLGESVLRALLRGNEMKCLIDRLNLAVETSNTFIGREITKISSTSSSSANILFATAYESVTPKYGYSINHDKVAGIVTMPFSNNRVFTKVPRYDSDDDGIADTVSPSVKIYIDGILRSSDDAVYNILNRRNDSFWIEQFSDAGEHTIEIELPPSLNKKFNYIEICPLPVFGFDITKIQYYDIHGDLQDIKVPDNIAINGPHVLHLSPKEFNNTIKITVSTMETNSVIGFTNIDIALVDYLDTSQSFYIEFANVPTVDCSIDAVLDFSVDNPESNYTNFIEDVRLVYDMNDDLVTTLIPMTGKAQRFNNIQLLGQLYLKVTMKEFDMTSAVFKGCRIFYTPTEA